MCRNHLYTFINYTSTAKLRCVCLQQQLTQMSDLAVTLTLSPRPSKSNHFICTSTQWLKWKFRGGETVISGFGPLLVVVSPLLTVLDHFAPVGGRGPKTTELTLLLRNQAFTFTYSTRILSHKNGKTANIQCTAVYAEMRMLAYRSVPLSVSCVFWKF